MTTFAFVFGFFAGAWGCGAIIMLRLAASAARRTDKQSLDLLYRPESGPWILPIDSRRRVSSSNAPFFSCGD